MSAVLTVSQINTYLKSIIDGDINLKKIYVCGEISNFTNHYRTGHFYFTLKDDRAAVKAVMFSSAAQRVRFNIQNGMKVIIRGTVGLYERDGVYQIYCEDIQPDGVGALNLAYEQLKEKLSELGLFDEDAKKPLPYFPKRIGVITSPTGAAIHDILTVLERRCPLCQVVFEPVTVQGDNAAAEIVNAIKRFNKFNAADVLIVGRGGGSIEDLWAFNEEIVAYAIYESEIPVISAVGHETDFTIADFVSDMRAATPSAAAEIAAPDLKEVLFSIDRLYQEMTDEVCKIVARYDEVYKNYSFRLNMVCPSSKLEMKSEKVGYLSNSLNKAIKNKLDSYQSFLGSTLLKLESLSPTKIMSKGYAVVSDKCGLTVSKAAKIKEGDSLKLSFADGSVECTANAVKIDNKEQS